MLFCGAPQGTIIGPFSFLHTPFTLGMKIKARGPHGQHIKLLNPAFGASKIILIVINYQNSQKKTCASFSEFQSRFNIEIKIVGMKILRFCCNLTNNIFSSYSILSSYQVADQNTSAAAASVTHCGSTNHNACPQLLYSQIKKTKFQEGKKTKHH